MLSQISRNLSMKTQVNEYCNIKETSAMLLLENAIAEAKKKNYKKALVEINQGFVEANKNEDIFMSSLLVLTVTDLEHLFICLFGCDKERRLSKQHEKKTLSFKKQVRRYEKDGVVNGGYITEYTEYSDQMKSQSLRSHKMTNTLDDHTASTKECLRRAYHLQRDLSNSKYVEKCVQSAFDIHFKAANFIACVTLLLQYQGKKVVEKIILSLNGDERKKLCHACVYVSTNKSAKNHPINQNIADMKLDYCLLACRICPQDEKSNELLCRIYRKASNFQKAFNTAKAFLDNVKPNSKGLIIQLLMCDLDCGKEDFVMERLEQLIKECKEDISDFIILKAFLLIEMSNIEQAMNIFKEMKMDELVPKIKYLTGQLNENIHEVLVSKTYKYYSEPIKRINDINDEEKTIFLLITQLLASKHQHNLKYAKVYGDCLAMCGEHELASQYFAQLIKYFENDTLPMIYLAALRLKFGAYNAAIEDFRAILSMIGSEKFMKDLSTLNITEREEIARVHRVHAFKYLTKNHGYKDAAECFTIAISAIGSKAVAIYLMRGFCYMHLNKYKEAKSDYDKCIEIDNSLVSAIFARAVVYAVTTHVEKAIRDFVCAYKLSGAACRRSITKLPLEHVLTFSQLVIQYIKQEIERVRMVSSTIFDSDSTNNKTEKTIDDLKPFNKEMLSYCDFLCAVFPTNLDYFSTYIECLLIQKEYFRAARHVETNMHRFQENNILVAWKAVISTLLKRFDEALVNLKYINEIDSNIQHIFSFISKQEKKLLLEFVFNQAVYLSAHENWQAALTFYDIAVRLSNKDLKAINGRMHCYEKLGITDKWLEDLCTIIKLEPNAGLLQMRARYYQYNGEHELSCEDFITALELNEEETIINVTINSNGSDVVEMFFQTASKMNDQNRCKDVLRLCETGLKLDHKHKGLKQLKDGTKMNLTKCVIQ